MNRRVKNRRVNSINIPLNPLSLTDVISANLLEDDNPPRRMSSDRDHSVHRRAASRRLDANGDSRRADSSERVFILARIAEENRCTRAESTSIGGPHPNDAAVIDIVVCPCAALVACVILSPSGFISPRNHLSFYPALSLSLSLSLSLANFFPVRRVNGEIDGDLEESQGFARIDLGGEGGEREGGGGVREEERRQGEG